MTFATFETFVGSVGSFARLSVETGIRLIIFAIPASVVAQWCDVPPTWKSAAYLAFCLMWFGCVFGGKKDSATQGDPSAADHRKAAKEVMTPAQVAAAARQLSTPKPPPLRFELQA